MVIILNVPLKLEEGNVYQEEWKPGSLVLDTKMSGCPRRSSWEVSFLCALDPPHRQEAIARK